jgi:hypothetical protein
VRYQHGICLLQASAAFVAEDFLKAVDLYYFVDKPKAPVKPEPAPLAHQERPKALVLGAFQHLQRAVRTQGCYRKFASLSSQQLLVARREVKILLNGIY